MVLPVGSPEQFRSERVGADSTDAVHLRPALRSGRKEPLHGAETVEQRTRRGVGNPGNPGQGGDSGRWPEAPMFPP